MYSLVNCKAIYPYRIQDHLHNWLTFKDYITGGRKVEKCWVTLTVMNYELDNG